MHQHTPIMIKKQQNMLQNAAPIASRLSKTSSADTRTHARAGARTHTHKHVRTHARNSNISEERRGRTEEKAEGRGKTRKDSGETMADTGTRQVGDVTLTYRIALSVPVQARSDTPSHPSKTNDFALGATKVRPRRSRGVFGDASIRKNDHALCLRPMCARFWDSPAPIPDL